MAHYYEWWYQSFTQDGHGITNVYFGVDIELRRAQHYGRHDAGDFRLLVERGLSS